MEKVISKAYRIGSTLLLVSGTFSIEFLFYISASLLITSLLLDIGYYLFEKIY